MLKPILRYVLLPISLLLTQCKPSPKAELPYAVGRPGQLVIVSDEMALQHLDSSLNRLFLSDPSVPDSASHPAFLELLKPAIPEFLKLFYNQRNVLVLVTSDNYETLGDALSPFSKGEIEQYFASPSGAIIFKQDVFAKHQSIAYLFCKEQRKLESTLSILRENIVNELLHAELDNLRASLTSDSSSNKRFFNEFKTKYGLGVNIPGTFRCITESSNFYWFQKDDKEDGRQKNIDLIVHAYPFNSATDLNMENILSVRDTFCKHHIPGELPGTYMSTSHSSSYPAGKMDKTVLNGHEAYKVSGWWTIKGLTMAGPFIRYVVPVPEKKILFVFEGFVYRPEIRWKENDIRIIEALAGTIQ